MQLYYPERLLPGATVVSLPHIKIHILSLQRDFYQDLEPRVTNANIYRAHSGITNERIAGCLHIKLTRMDCTYKKKYALSPLSLNMQTSPFIFYNHF